MANNEKQPGFQGEKEVSFDAKELSAANERLSEHHERSVENAPETRPESARHEALEQAKTIEKEKQPEQEAQEKSPETRRPMSKKHRDATFSATMETVQADMSAPSRAFSKVIHNKVVDATSEAVGSTIARPNAILAGAMAAFIVTLAIYLIAKHYGYPLSGFETIGAFIAGWLIGTLFDFFRVMITGKR